MKTKILDPKSINDDTIKSILDNGAIDHHDNDGIYVTGYPINFWMDVDQNRKLLIMYSYWKIAAEVDEIDILRSVNNANSDKIRYVFRSCGLGLRGEADDEEDDYSSEP